MCVTSVAKPDRHHHTYQHIYISRLLVIKHLTHAHRNQDFIYKYRVNFLLLTSLLNEAEKGTGTVMNDECNIWAELKLVNQYVFFNS